MYKGRVLTSLVRPVPTRLIVTLALLIAGVLAAFLAVPAQAQESELPLITIQAELRTGETSIPRGTPAVFHVTRSRNTSGDLTVRLFIYEPYRPVDLGSAQQSVQFRDGESVVVIRALAQGALNAESEQQGNIRAQIVNRNAEYETGSPDFADVSIRVVADEDKFVTIAAEDGSIAEGENAEFTLTRTGGVSSALTVNVRVADPGDAMRGNHWDDALQPGDYQKEVTFAADATTATASFPTRPNVRDTGDLTLTASVYEGDELSVWVGTPFSATVDVEDDDTAPEVSLSVDPNQIIEGEEVTFTVTRHGDTSEALEDLFTLTIGPDYRRRVWPIWEVPQDYEVAMDAGQRTVDLVFTVHRDFTRRDGGEQDFRFEAEFKFALAGEIPEEHQEQYLSIRGERKVGVAVQNQALQRVTFVSIGSTSIPSSAEDGYRVREVFSEGQQVPLVIGRSGDASQIARELEVRIRYIETDHPGRVYDPTTGYRYNPSEQIFFVTFPAGETRASATVTVTVDDVTEQQGYDWWVMHLDRLPLAGYSGQHSTRMSVIGGVIRDNVRAVSIAAVDNALSTDDESSTDDEPTGDDEPTIEEGDTAEFILTRLGPTDEAFTVNVVVDDPGHFRRGNHWRDTPDTTLPVTFAADASTATLSVPTRDDDRDIPDNTLTVTVPPSQDGSYRPAHGDEGEDSASFTVTDNDTAPRIVLSVSASTIIEGATSIFSIRRDNSDNNLDFNVMYGLRGAQEPRVYGLGRGEDELLVRLAPEDDDYDDPDQRVYEMTLLPWEAIPEDAWAQYWTVNGPTTVSVTVTDNDLPLVWVEPVEESFEEGFYGEFRFGREGQTGADLGVKGRLSQVGNSYFNNYQYLLGQERTYNIPADSESKDRLFQLQWDDGDEGDTSMTMELLPDPTRYRIDPERASATFIVTDDDPEPTLSVSGATASEGAGEITFRVSVSSMVSPPSRRTITLDYATRNGAAKAGEDFTAHTGTLTIQPQQTSATIAVPLVDDRWSELEESFTLVLSNPVNAVLQDAQEELTAEGTITDDEPFVSMSAVEDEINEGDEAVLEFTRTGATTEALTIFFRAGYFNHRASYESVEIPVGQSSVRWSFVTEEDEKDRPDRRYIGRLVDQLPAYYFSTGPIARITVRDDDLPVVTIEADSEGVHESYNADFTLTREGWRGVSLTVNVSVTRTGALFPSADPPPTVTFAVGSATTSLSVPTQGDTTLEDHGSVAVSIADGDEYEAGEPASATVSVADDDRRGVAVAIAYDTSVVDEGENAVFVLTRTGGIDLVAFTARVKVVEVRNSKAGLYETWPEDSEERGKFVNYSIGLYSETDYDVLFDAGSATATLTIPTVDESYNDGNSYFKATMPLSGSYRLDPYPGIAVVWVRDDDIPTVTITQPVAALVEKDDDGEVRGHVFTLHRTGNVDTQLRVLMGYRTVHHHLEGDIWIPRPGLFLPTERRIGAAQASRTHKGILRLAPIEGAEEFRQVVPNYCVIVPGDCGTTPQYRVGTPGSTHFVMLNDALGLRIEADQETVTEGETATFTLSRFGATHTLRVENLTVRVGVTQNGRFIDGIPPQTVYFAGYPDEPASEAALAATLSIPTLDDDTLEGDGSIEVVLLASADLNEAYELIEFVGTGRASVVVEDNDQGAISIVGASVVEADEYIEFVVTVPATYEETTVEWATSDGTATAGSDYEAASGEIVFDVGDTSKRIRVPLKDDSTPEADETFIVTLSNPTVAVLSSASAMGTIRDDDVVPVLTVTTSGGDVEEGETASFTFSRRLEGSGLQPESFASQRLTVSARLSQQGSFFIPDGENYGDVKVDYETATGIATLTIPGGQLDLTLNLATDDDTQAEADGSITLTLSERPEYDVGSPASATVNVTDNDVGISIASASEAERVLVRPFPTAFGDENVGSLSFTVTLSRPATEDVTVQVSTEDDTATDNPDVTNFTLGRDYHTKSETLTFSPGETEKAVSVSVVDDTFDELSTERFWVVLSKPSDNASILNGTAAGSISDNDDELMLGVYREGRTVNEDAEGPVTFRFERKAQEGSGTTGSERIAWVGWTVNPGTARAGQDYTAFADIQMTHLPRNVMTSSVEVFLIDDNLFEKLDETFTLEIRSLSDGMVRETGRQSVEIKIRDDDRIQADVAAVHDNVLEGDDASFTITLAPSLSTAPVEVTYAVVGTAGSADYVPPSGTLTIPVGESSGTVTISTLVDNILDPGETLGVLLTRATSNEREITIPPRGDSPPTVTILDQTTLSASIIAGEPADEGDNVEFTVRLSIASDAPVQVDWETSDGEGQAAATDGDDYTSASGTVAVPAGDTTATFTVATLEDNLFEGDETFLARLTGAKRGAVPDSATSIDLGVSSATATITDNNSSPSVITLTVTPESVSEGAGETELSVTATLGGESRLPHDLLVGIGLVHSVTIPAGQASGTSPLTFTPVDDEIDGEDTTERIEGLAPGFNVIPATFTITDDDDPPTGASLTAAPNTLGEGAGKTDLTVTGALTGGSLRSVDTQVTLFVEGVSIPSEDDDGDPSTAAGSDDFTAPAGVTLTIPAGQRTATATVTFTPTNDIMVEGDETAQVSGDSGDLEVSPAVLTIEDDDDEPDGIRLSASPAAAREDAGAVDVQVTATLEGGGARMVATTLLLSAAGVTAAVGEDFTEPLDVSLTIQAGQMSGVATLSISLMNDNIHENTEQVAIRGTNEDPGLPVTGARVSITDDDEAPTQIVLSIDRAEVSEGGGPQQRKVTAEFQGSRRPVGTLLFLTLRAGTAVERDYSALTATLTIPAGQQEGVATIVVFPTNDYVVEGDETVQLRGSTSLPDLEVQPAFVTITDDDTAGVTITPAALVVSEGSSGTYMVVLDNQPSGDVTVTVSGQADTDLTLTGLSAANTLTFTTSNWFKAQTVTVTAGEDDDGVDGTATLTHTATGGEYGGTTATLPVTVADDDRGLILSRTSLDVDEGDATGVSYTVELATQPTEEITVTVTGHSGTDLTLTGLSAANALTFTTSNWFTGQTVTVTAGEDDDGVDDTATLTHTASGGGYAGKTATLPVTVEDDDAVAVLLSRTSIDVDEGDPTGVSYTVKLATQPTEEITVTVTGHSGTGLTLSGLSAANTLTFTTTNWNAAQTVTVKAGQDDDAVNDRITLQHSAAGGDYGGKTLTLTVTVNDDDPAEIILSTASVSLVEGNTTGRTYTVKLSSEPTADVTVTVSGHASTDLRLTGLSAADTLTFTDANWASAQTVTVRAVQDADSVNDSVVLTHTPTGGDYAGRLPKTVSVTVSDDERAQLVISPSPLPVAEGNTTGATYTVKLATQPTEDVTITVSGQSGTSLTLTGLSSAGTLTFTDANWNTNQTVRVKAEQDDNATNETITLTHTAAGGEYEGKTADLSVNVDDDDTAAIVLTPPAITVDEGGATGVSYTVELATQPSEEVTVTVTGHSGTDLTLTGLSAANTLTFTADNWNTAQTVTVKAGEDADGLDDSVTLTHTAAGGGYGGTTAELPVTVADNDRGLVLSRTSLTVGEGDATGVSYTVELATQPTEEITVTVTGHSGTDLTIAGLSAANALTFTADNWNAAQTVTVKAGEDDDGVDDSVTLTHTAAGGGYGGTTAELPVTVADNDRGLVLSRTSLTVGEGDATGVSYTVELATQPTEEITVTVTGHSGTDLTLTGLSAANTLTFTADNWDTPQRVTVKAGEDSDGLDDSVTLTHTAAGGGYGGTTAALAVTVADNDRGLVLSRTSLDVDEGDATGVSYTVELATQPTEEITVTVTGHSGADLTLTGLSAANALTFTADNWDTAQTVTVTAGEDDDGVDDTATLTHTAAGGGYGGTTATLLVTVNDDAPATATGHIFISFDSAYYTATEGGDPAEVSVQLSEVSGRPVVIRLSATGHEGATEDDWSGVPESVSFDAGETSKSFRVIAVDDSVEDNGEMVELGFDNLPNEIVAGTPSTARVTLMNDDQGCDDGIQYWEDDVEVDNKGKSLRDQDSFIGGHTPLLGIGETLEGYINRCEDWDMFSFDVEEDKYYRVDHLGSSSLDGTLSLPQIAGYFTAQGAKASFYKTRGEPVWYRPSDGKRPFMLHGSQEWLWVHPNDEPSERQENWDPILDGGSRGSGPGTNSRDFLVKWPAGKYYMMLFAPYGTIGTYRISLKEVADDDSGIRSIAMDGSATGYLEYPLDEDTFEVTLKENHNYVILVRPGDSDVPLSELSFHSLDWGEWDPRPFVSRVEDVGASTEYTYPDGNRRPDRSFVFTAATTGVHRITVEGYTESRVMVHQGDGSYKLAVTDVGTSILPPPPQNLAAVANADGSITLTWDDPDNDYITGYQNTPRLQAEKLLSGA